MDLVQQLGIGKDAFELRHDNISPALNLDSELCLFIDALTMNMDTLKEEIQADQTPEDPRFTDHMGLALKEILLKRLKSYKTTVAEDVALIHSEHLSKRLNMAVQVRLGEKKLIAAAINGLDWRIRGISNQHGSKMIEDNQDIQEIMPQAKQAKKTKA